MYGGSPTGPSLPGTHGSAKDHFPVSGGRAFREPLPVNPPATSVKNDGCRHSDQGIGAEVLEDRNRQRPEGQDSSNSRQKEKPRSSKKISRKQGSGDGLSAEPSFATQDRIGPAGDSHGSPGLETSLGGGHKGTGLGVCPEGIQ